MNLHCRRGPISTATHHVELHRHTVVRSRRAPPPNLSSPHKGSRSSETSSDLVRSRRIWRDLVGFWPDLAGSATASASPSPVLSNIGVFADLLLLCFVDFLLWWVFCCGDVCCCLVRVIFYLFVVVTPKTRENRPTCSPKPINQTARSDHLNGWSTGWSFANPTQSGRIEKSVQTQPAQPVPTLNRDG